MLPVIPAAIIGVVTTYWSWSLAMYREVGDGHPLGVIDAVARVTTEGLRLPWLTTLEQLGYVPQGVFAVPLLLLLTTVLLIMWRAGFPERAISRRAGLQI